MKPLVLSALILISIEFLNAQDFSWAIQVGGEGNDAGSSIAIDDFNNIYTVGTFSADSDFDPTIDTLNLTSNGISDIFILKQNTEGDILWVRQIGGEGQETVSKIKVDQEGNIYLTGTFEKTVDFNPNIGTYNLTSESIFEDGFLLKLSNMGEFIWAIEIDGENVQFATNLVIDNLNYPIIVGSFYGETDFDPTGSSYILTGTGAGFIAKYSPLGLLIWAKSYIGEGLCNVNSIEINSENEILTCGNFTHSIDFDPGVDNYELIAAGEFYDIFFTKLNANGEFIFANKIGTIDITATQDVATGIAFDSDNYIYITGYFYNTIDFDPTATEYLLTAEYYGDAFVSKYNNSGEFVWVKQITGAQHQKAMSIMVDNFNNLVVAGYFSTTFESPSDSIDLTSNGVEDVFFCQFSPEGEIIWLKSFGGNNGDFGYDIVSNDGINFYGTGKFYATVDFNPLGMPSLLESFGLHDAFVYKIGPINQIGIINDINVSLEIFPNPNNGEFTIKNYTQDMEGEIIIYNSQGSRVYSKRLNRNNYTVKLDLAPGYYTIAFKDYKNYKFISHFIIL